MDEVTLPFVDTSPETIARKAAAKAAAIDVEQAATQPPPDLPPVRGEQRTRVRVGSIDLPFFSTLQDPARINGTHSRSMRQFRPRVVECVACERKKLETRLGDPATLGIDPAKLRPDQRHHFGPGERDYTLCKTCYDTNGTLHSRWFELFAAKRRREEQQATLRGAPDFAKVADRVARIDRWRRDVYAAREFGEALAPRPVREGRRRREDPYDGFSDDRVLRQSDFTDQSAPESPSRLLPLRAGTVDVDAEAAAAEQLGGRRGRSRVGDADPMWRANDAEHDPRRVGADHAAAIIEDEKWEARRTKIFRRRLEKIEKIEDPVRRERSRAALYRRWDARLSPSERNPEKAEVTNPFARVRKTMSPYPGTTLHSGVDENFASEPAYVRQAHARHLARVEEFLAEAPGKLAAMGYSEEKIAELTALPPLEPERLRRYSLDEPPLRERFESEDLRTGGPRTLLVTDRGLERASGHGLRLAPAADLDAADREAREGQHVRLAREVAAEIGKEGGGVEGPRTSADDFIDLTDRVHKRAKLTELVGEADAAREHVSHWARTIHHADRDLQAATDAFAREIAETFHDPRAFQAAFKQLSDDDKRAMLVVLRERPGDFAREFRTAGGNAFGDAGRLATGKRKVPAESTVGARERSGILTAEAGVRYLEAVSARKVVREQAAGALGLPETTSFDGLRNACREQMREANAKKDAALRERVSMGKVPSRKELGAAFSDLSQPDRSRVMREVPGVSRLLEPRGRRLARTGPSL
jgi:hypothetical protein